MKRSGFKKPTYQEALEKKKAAERRAKQRVATKPRKKPKKRAKAKNKPSMRILKDRLWKECKRLMRKLHPHVCYTCGKSLKDGTADFHTGHFIPSSICSTEMRYDLDNLRPQCSACNIWKSGNWPAYEAHLIKDGIDVQELKDRNERTKGEMYRADWYQQKIEEYKNL